MYPTKRNETLRALHKHATLRGQHHNNTGRENCGRENSGRGNPGRERGNPGRTPGVRKETPPRVTYTLVQLVIPNTPIDQVQCFNYKGVDHRVRDCPEDQTNGNILVTHRVKNKSFDWTFTTVATRAFVLTNCG